MRSIARPACLVLFAAAGGALYSAPAEEEPVVFRSGVTLVRVDAQVVDSGNRAIAGLRVDDFILLEEGREQPIRNFEREEMAVDILLLLDVSGSMRSHVERIASASSDALQTLAEGDRVGIMVFDRSTRLRLPFRSNRSEIERGLNMVLQQEDFNGGTDITRGLLDAAGYVAREGRKGARRAIVILTDDQTERGREEERVSRALAHADAVLSALLAPDAMRSRRRVSQGGSWPSGPTMGGPMGGPLGGIIFGRRGPYGRRTPGPVVIGRGTRSAGTAEIARRSGGDSFQVDEASAFERTLARIRERYALYFHLPQGVKGGQERTVDVQLASAALRRYPDAQVNFRRVYLAPGGPADPSFSAGEAVEEVSQAPVSAPAPEADTAGETSDGAEADSGLKRRPAVSERSGPRPPNLPAARRTEPKAETAPSQGGWRRVEQRSGGWRRATPADTP